MVGLQRRNRLELDLLSLVSICNYKFRFGFPHEALDSVFFRIQVSFNSLMCPCQDYLMIARDKFNKVSLSSGDLYKCSEEEKRRQTGMKYDSLTD